MRERWSFKTFGDIMSPARVIRCSERKLPVLSITMRNGIVEQNERFNKSIASKDRSNYKVVKNGQLVIAFPIDEGLIYTQDIVSEGIMSPAYNVWDVNYNLVDRRFLVAYFHSSYAFTYYKAKLKGTTQRRRSMDKSDLLSMPIPIPPLDEQERIVEELDLLSSIIDKKKAQLKELDQLAQSIFYDMFGDPITNEKGWEVKKLGEVCEYITDGDHMPPPKSDIGIPFLTIGNINKETRELDFKNTFFVPQAYYDNLKDERRSKIGDILYTVTGSYGIPIIVKTEKLFCFQRHIALIRPKHNIILTQFLCSLLLTPSMKNEADMAATGIAQKTVGLSSLRRFIIPLPPLPLQKEFASKVEAIERQKSLIQQSIVETQTLFDSRMDHWFG